MYSKRALRSLRSLSHDRWVPERDGCPNTGDSITYVDMCCRTLGWRDARVYQRGGATCNHRNLFVSVHATTLDAGIMVRIVRVISLFTQMTSPYKPVIDHEVKP